jgi:hypothetical protein
LQKRAIEGVSAARVEKFVEPKIDASVVDKFFVGQFVLREEEEKDSDC